MIFFENRYPLFGIMLKRNGRPNELFRRDGKAQVRNEGSAVTLITDSANERQRTMDEDRVKGTAHQAKGKVKEKVGQVTGDTKTEAEGKAEKAAGKVQNAVGGMKDAMRGDD